MPHPRELAWTLRKSVGTFDSFMGCQNSILRSTNGEVNSLSSCREGIVTPTEYQSALRCGRTQMARDLAVNQFASGIVTHRSPLSTFMQGELVW